MHQSLFLVNQWEKCSWIWAWTSAQVTQLERIWKRTNNFKGRLEIQQWYWLKEVSQHCVRLHYVERTLSISGCNVQVETLYFPLGAAFKAVRNLTRQHFWLNSFRGDQLMLWLPSSYPPCARCDSVEQEVVHLNSTTKIINHNSASALTEKSCFGHVCSYCIISYSLNVLLSSRPSFGENASSVSESARARD